MLSRAWYLNSLYKTTEYNQYKVMIINKEINVSSRLPVDDKLMRQLVMSVCRISFPPLITKHKLILNKIKL